MHHDQLNKSKHKKNSRQQCTQCAHTVINVPRGRSASMSAMTARATCSCRCNSQNVPGCCRPNAATNASRHLTRHAGTFRIAVGYYYNAIETLYIYIIVPWCHRRRHDPTIQDRRQDKWSVVQARQVQPHHYDERRHHTNIYTHTYINIDTIIF